MPAYVPLLAVLAVLLAFPPPIRVAAGWAPVRGGDCLDVGE